MRACSLDESGNPLLERVGYACATAENGVGAHRLLASEPFELIVCDLQMPGESGST